MSIFFLMSLLSCRESTFLMKDMRIAYMCQMQLKNLGGNKVIFYGILNKFYECQTKLQNKNPSYLINDKRLKSWCQTFHGVHCIFWEFLGLNLEINWVDIWFLYLENLKKELDTTCSSNFWNEAPKKWNFVLAVS